MTERPPKKAKESVGPAESVEPAESVGPAPSPVNMPVVEPAESVGPAPSPVILPLTAEGGGPTLFSYMAAGLYALARRLRGSHPNPYSLAKPPKSIPNPYCFSSFLLPPSSLILPPSSFKKRGMAYVAVLLLLVLMTVMGMAFLLKAHTESMVALKRQDNMKAHYLAEAAANHALWFALNKKRLKLPGKDQNLYYMHSLGDGRYGYKITGGNSAARPTTVTIATVGAVAGAQARQSYVAHLPKIDISLPGLLAWWKLDDASGLVAIDSKSTHDGALTNMAGDEWRSSCMEDGGLQFDGVDDYIDVGDVASAVKSISFWMKADNVGLPVKMDTGLKTPSNYRDSNTDWQVAQNAYASNDKHAIGRSQGDAQDWHDFDFVIPASATIDGIEVSVESRDEKGNGTGAEVELSWDGGGSYTSTGTSFSTTSEIDVTRTLGSLTNTWGRAWTVSDLSNANFRIKLTKDSLSNDNHEVDQIQVKIHYTPVYSDSVSIMDLNGASKIKIESGDITPVAFPGATLVYVDGTTETAITTAWHHVIITNSDGLNDSALEIGRVFPDYFSGILDDIRLYDYVLTTEVSEYLAKADQIKVKTPSEVMLSSDGMNIILPLPDGTSEGDLLIATVVTDAQESLTLSPPLGEGWTRIDMGTGFNAVTVGVWWKLAGASESPTHQFSWGSSEQAYGWMMRFTGHDPFAPINAFLAESGASSATPPTPSVTTTVDNALILRIGGFDDDDIDRNNMGLTGHTKILMGASNIGNGTCSGGAGYLIQESAGASDASSFSLTGGEQYRCVSIAIAPAP